MARHVLERSQTLPITLERAWDFFSTPRNLALITPPGLGLSIREPFDDRPAFNGQLITYTVRPLLRIPLRWVTRIEEVSAPVRFVDTQLQGPYRLWRHTHAFEAVPNGVHMRDRVEYELPLGPLGELAHMLWVRRELDRIFDHRALTLATILLPESEPTGGSDVRS
ncbi:MAG TPA: SRPBCC family protein [Flavobacteriales bacterium]|nr:SRPBCC family protein [Flavobacteriales bacterium]HNU55464.1 SRPBCC family protein [Flavobacteriales bacterium]